jgi:hypothetical protein
MLSGAGEALAEERLEEEGDGYERREARASERDMTESSESDMSEREESDAAGEGAEEGTELKGELGAWVAVVGASIWVKGRKRSRRRHNGSRTERQLAGDSGRRRGRCRGRGEGRWWWWW